MRISDWSSDVCSSDLPGAAERPELPAAFQPTGSRAPEAVPVARMEQVEMADPLDAQVIRREDQARLARAGVIDKCTLHGRRGSVGIIAYRDREQWAARSEEHTSELQSLMRNSYAVFWL